MHAAFPLLALLSLSACTNLFSPAEYRCVKRHYAVATYDDGPNGWITNTLLDTLARKGITATFFVLGTALLDSPENQRLLKRAYSEGHTIGNHSWSHPNLAWMEEAEIRREIARTNDLIHELIGVTPRFFRPPFGEASDRVRRVVRDMGMAIVGWNVDLMDYEGGHLTARDMRYRMKGQVVRRESCLILMHDLHKVCYEAIGTISRRLWRRHKKIVPLQTCLGGEPYL